MRGSFVDAVDGPGAEGPHGEFGLAVATDHDDGGGVAAAGEFAEDFEAVGVGEDEVEEEEVDAALGHAIEAKLAVFDGFQLPRGLVMGEVEADDRRNVRIVLGMEHAGHGGWDVS